MIRIKRNISFFDKIKRLPIRYFLFLILLSSCVGPYMLQQTLERYKIPLGYTFDSKIDTLKSNKKICLRVIDNLKINDATIVQDNGFLLVPLIIAGGYKGDFTVFLGENNVQPSFAEFIFNSFQTEAGRSGNFRVAKKEFRSDYILEVTLQECQISSKYHKDRIRYAKYTIENWVLKPVIGRFIIDVQLLKNKGIVFRRKVVVLNKIYSSDKSSQPLAQRFKSEYSMNSKMMKDFASTASLEIKEILESIVRDVNEHIE
jgi:hypothetical protein